VLHVRLTELHAAHQSLPPAIRTLSVKETIQNKIYTENERNLTIVVRAYNVHIMCHRAKFHKNRLNRGRDMVIITFFKMADTAIFDFQNFNFSNSQNGQEGGTASLCQMLSKSLQPWPRYRDFSIFLDGGRRRLGFSKFEIFNVRSGHKGRTA